MLRSDATSTSMHSYCEDQLVRQRALVSQGALSRSALLADIHWVDPIGCVRMPCDVRTPQAWETDDPSRMTADNMDLMLDVIRVRSLYTLE
jgi:hypothetical protein